MLSPVSQIGRSSPEMPLALFQKRPAEDWLRLELDDLELVAPEQTADNLLSQIPLAFLRRLLVDVSLRAELEADPVSALARHGIHVAPEQIPASVRLPSPEALEGALRVYATAEDESWLVRWGGFLGGLFDDLFGDLGN